MAKQTNRLVKFAITNSENKAKDPSVEDDMIVFCDETGKTPKIFKGGKAYGGDGSESTFDNGDTSGVAIGGIDEGYTLSDKTAKEVLDDILHPTYAPYKVDATASLTCEEHNTGSVEEVGVSTPTEASYEGKGSAPSFIGKAGTYEASGGTVTKTLTKSGTAVAEYNTKVTKPGTFVVTNTVTWAKGSDIVKDSKGNTTNKTGGSASKRTLLTKAAANTSDLVLKTGSDTEYVVKASTSTTQKTATHTIYYRYKVYAATETNGTLTEQGLLSSMEVTLKGGSDICFALPATYTGVKVREYNANSGKYDIEGDYPETEDDITYKNGANEDVAYKKYKRSAANGADIKVTINYTIA